MNVETYIVLTRDEINRNIPYAVVCETMSGAKWGTGIIKRLRKATETPKMIHTRRNPK